MNATVSQIRDIFIDIQEEGYYTYGFDSKDIPDKITIEIAGHEIVFNKIKPFLKKAINELKKLGFTTVIHFCVGIPGYTDKVIEEKKKLLREDVPDELEMPKYTSQWTWQKDKKYFIYEIIIHLDYPGKPEKPKEEKKEEKTEPATGARADLEKNIKGHSDVCVCHWCNKARSEGIKAPLKTTNRIGFKQSTTPAAEFSKTSEKPHESWCVCAKCEAAKVKTKKPHAAWCGCSDCEDAKKKSKRLYKDGVWHIYDQGKWVPEKEVKKSKKAGTTQPSGQYKTVTKVWDQQKQKWVVKEETTKKKKKKKDTTTTVVQPEPAPVTVTTTEKSKKKVTESPLAKKAAEEEEAKKKKEETSLGSKIKRFIDPNSEWWD